MDVGILIPAHFEKPFSAWRNSKQFAERHVQVVQLFTDRGEYGIEIFGGKNFPCEKYVLLDIETSGLNEERDRVISVSADKIIGGKLTECFFSLVAFEGSLPPEIANLTGIRDEMLKGKPDLDTVMNDFETFRGNLPVYADNAPFVRKFLKKYNLEIDDREKKPLSPRFFDALIDGAQNEKSLIALCKTDIKYFRDTYSVCEMKIVRAGEETELASKIAEIAAEPYDAFFILLRIPKYALEKMVRNTKPKGKVCHHCDRYCTDEAQFTRISHGTHTFDFLDAHEIIGRDTVANWSQKPVLFVMENPSAVGKIAVSIFCLIMTLYSTPFF